MTLTRAAALCLLLTMAPMAAMAQSGFTADVISGQVPEVASFPTTVRSGSASRIGAFDDPSSARDGCVNVPGQAHNSADCSRITSWDPSWVVPNKRLDEMTGAEENMMRSYNILHPMTPEALRQAIH